jgi:hypothetical protein
LRNIFDQYSQPENRVTHALMTALNEDRNLLGRFLRELVTVKPPTDPRGLSVLEQQYPGEEEPSEDELERRGVPDGWISDNEGWCVLIESKVIAKLTADQIHRHRRTAERRGFKRITVVAITPRKPAALPPQTVLLEWRTIYAWLCRHSRSSIWAARAADYLEVAEAKLIETEQFVEGTLTQFSGFPFGAGSFFHPSRRQARASASDERTERTPRPQSSARYESKSIWSWSNNWQPRGCCLGFSVADASREGRGLH